MIINQVDALFCPMVDPSRGAEQRRTSVKLEFAPEFLRFTRQPNIERVFVSAPEYPGAAVRTAVVMANGKLFEQDHGQPSPGGRPR
jgi:hypothetical protein